MWLLSPAGGWGRRVGRWFSPGSTAWLLQEDEEILVLAQTDEHSRPYGEEARPGLPQNQPSASPASMPAGAHGETQPRRNGLGRECGEARGDAGGATGGDGRGETQRTTVSSPELDREEPLTPPPPSAGPRITTWEAGWNVTNAIQGVFVLGLPYALLQSGYLGLVLLPLAAAMCNYTGQILVSCLYEEDEGGRRVRVRGSYADVADACCRGLCPLYPRLGGALVNLAQLVELVMTCTLYLVVSGDLLSSALPRLLPAAATGSASVSAAAVVVRPLGTLLALLPCLLLADLRAVSRLSLLCSLPQLLTSLLVILHCLGRAGSWAWDALPLAVDHDRLLVAAGVIIFSYTSQIFLPTLEGSMENRQEFCSMLGWTHGLACLLKTLFSLVALLTWGGATREVITDNLPPGLQTLVNLCLLAKALLSYPLPFYAAAELLLASLRGGGVMSGEGAGSVVAAGGGVTAGEGAQSGAAPNSEAGVRSGACGVIADQGEEAGFTAQGVNGRGGAPGPRGGPWCGAEAGAMALRGGLLLLTFLLAQLAPRVSLLMGLTGSVTGAAVSLVLPCAFHLRLRWAGLSRMTRALDLAILALGSLCSLSGLLCSVRSLLRTLSDG